MKKILTILTLSVIFATPLMASTYLNRPILADTIKKSNYTIFSKSSTVENLSINKNKKSTEEVLTIRFGYPNVMPTNTIGGAIQTSKQAVDSGVAPEIKNVVIVNGKYEDMGVVKDGSKRNKYTLTGLKFPLRLQIKSNTDIIDVELNEPGKWNIDIELKNN
jgi:hypothetical protein